MHWAALIHRITNQALRGWIPEWASGCQCHLCQIEGKITKKVLGFALTLFLWLCLTASEVMVIIKFDSNLSLNS